MKVDRERLIFLIKIYIINFTIISSLFYISLFYLNRPYYPYTPLWQPSLRLGDLLEGYLYITNGNPYLNSEAFAVANYPPFGYFFYELLNLLNIEKLQHLVLLYFTALVPVFFLVKKSFQIKKDVFILFFLIFLNYPFFFSLERGNLEIFVCYFIIVSYFVKNEYAKAFYISIAASLKFTPLIFLFIFFNNKKFKFFIFGLGNFLVINFFSFSFFKGNNLNEFKIFIHNVVNWIDWSQPSTDNTLGLWDPISSFYAYYLKINVPETIIIIYQTVMFFILVIILFVIWKYNYSYIFCYSIISIYYVIAPAKSYTYKYAVVIFVILYFIDQENTYNKFYLSAVAFTFFPLDFVIYFERFELNSITTPIICFITLVYLLSKKQLNISENKITISDNNI